MTQALASQNQALMTQGRHLWATNCASCHGTSGEGGSAPALNSQEFLTTVTDDQIHGIIAGGIPGHGDACVAERLRRPAHR